ncbi:chemotaxis protein CheZ [Hydrogenivirga caldilitoris]|uniref:Chemotaxis protein CheZ n=1 Tax=Hydrogenivirga caldilitoris TaxID=246264 RepID=A0A497XSQ4_9AQUI|nr:protein phosphatase CheZ [Hydrogenivirga caldilitoris]RLJ71129.1 chemotaxis protein CheZ [Hydrogenivirga caldilitoris]
MKELEEIIKELISNVKELENVIEGIKKPVSESSQLLPETAKNIEDVMVFLEQTSHTIMNYLEKVNENSESIEKDVEFLLSLSPIPKVRERLENIKGKNQENLKILMELYTHMSFHDLAGQQLKTVLQVLENIKRTLLDIIVSHVAAGKNLKAEEVSGIKGKVSELLSQDRINQEDVDKLLEEFGL